MSFSVYRSSAGSGKTFTLVRDYLGILLSDLSTFRHILAATFTNKAADEMKQRIIVSLAALSFQEAQAEPMRQALIEIGVDSSLITANARKALKKILHDYYDFSVGTIDSFMNRVVRTFARDLSIPSSFEVSLEVDETAQLVTDLVLEQVGIDQDLTRVMKEFVQNKISEDRNPALEKDLMEYVKILLGEESLEHLELLKGWDTKSFFTLNTSIRKRIKQRDEALKAIGKEALDLLEKHHLEGDHFHYKRQGVCSRFLAAALGDWKKAKPSPRILKAVDEDKWMNAKIDPLDRARLEMLLPDVKAQWFRLMDFLDTESREHTDDILVSSGIYLLALAVEIRKRLDILRDESNLLPISDVSALVARITLSEAVPFIYERLGERYQHFLLDEFQDTSVLQWHNLIPLLENALAGGGNAFIAGDSKQSIYRWRAGDAEQFQNLPHLSGKKDYPLLKEREQSFIHFYQETPLNSNYRSDASVVDFNNRFFTFAASQLPESVQKAYSALEQGVKRTERQGQVLLQFVDIENKDKYAVYGDQILAYINEETKERRPYSDIAILCRGNADASILAEMLLREKIPVISAESVVLSASSRVRSLIALMKLLLDPEDRLSRLELIRDMVLLGRWEGISLQEILRESGLENTDQSAAEFFHWFHRNAFPMDRAAMLTRSLYDLAEELIRSLDYADIADVYLQFLLENVDAYVAKKDGTLSGFIKWWNTKGYKESIAVPEGLNAVRILTIHKAKGLQYPVVIYPVFPEKYKLTRKQCWIHLNKDRFETLESAFIKLSGLADDSSWADIYQEERDKSSLDILNVHYVALTRACQQLFVILDTPPEKESQTSHSMSLNKLVKAFLEAEGLWATERSSYVYGDEYLMKEGGGTGKTDEFAQVENIFSISSYDWEKRLRLNLRAPEYWEAGITKDAVSWGLLAHRVLASVNTMDDLKPAIKREIIQGNLQEKDAQYLQQKITGIIANPLLCEFFNKDYEIRNESELILTDGRFIRPDRVLIRNNKAVVIDYKTGKIYESHKDQIREYGGVLLEAGYENVEAYLAYLPAGEVVKVNM